MYKIYVNDIQIDTYNINNIVINALLFDISNPANRGVKSSNKIIIPKTANNIRIFEFYDEDIFSKTYKADIYDDTIHLIRGNVKITDIEDNITIQITESFKQISEDLKKPLYELDLTSADFTYGFAAYNTLHAATTGFFSWEVFDNRLGFSAGVINFPAFLPDPHIGVFRPSYLVLNVVEKIFTELGYTVDSSELDSIVSDLRLISNADSFWIAFYQVTHVSTSLTAGVSLPLPLASGGAATVDFIWDNTANQDFDDIINPEIKINSTGHFVDNTKFVIEIDIDEDAELLVIEKTGVAGTQITINRYAISKTGTVIVEGIEHSATKYFEFQFNINVTINQIRVICLAEEAEIYASGPAHTWVDGTDLVNWTRFTGAAATNSLLDDFYVKAQYNLPDWTQLEFLQEFWNIFNIEFVIEGKSVILRHNTTNDFIEITDYITDTKKIGDNTLYAKFNKFGYNNDLFNFLKKYDAKTLEKDILKLKSDSSEQSIFFDLIPVFPASVPVYTVTSPRNTNTADRLTVNERFLISEANATITISIPNASEILLFDVGLSWIDLYDSYYTDRYNFLQDSKIITYRLKINYNIYSRILNLKKIYDKNLGRELTVLRINKYNPSRLTEIIAATKEI